MKYWLLKSEPDVWSIDQQEKAGNKGAAWDGVRNYQASKNLKTMKIGDKCFFGAEAEFFIFDDVKWSTSQEYTFFSIDSSFSFVLFNIFHRKS